MRYLINGMAEVNSKNSLSQLEVTLEEYFGKKAPAIPQNIKEVIVKIAPYLSILSAILILPSLLLLLGIGGLATVVAPLGGASAVTQLPTMWIGILFLIPVVILEVMAIPGLFARKAVAWRYLYWAQLISAVSSVVQFNIIGAIISLAIGLYLLFQVKSFYK
jgi:hypothetical protein